MKIADNPFHSVYISDRMESPRDFYELFSPAILAGNAMAVFEVGNTILVGTDGIGKSMLLKLLDWSIRGLYVQTENQQSEMGLSRLLEKPWLSINMNLSISNLLQMGSRDISTNESENIYKWISSFGDCFNYYAIQQLCQMLDSLTIPSSNILKDSLCFNSANLDNFAKELAECGCFFGYLSDCTSYSNLKRKINSRIQSYRSFVNWNTPSIPDDIQQTKTTISAPISQAVNCLRKAKVVANDVSLFVAIDQLEFLQKIDQGKVAQGKESLGVNFVRSIMSCLSNRDTRVCYKIACRPYVFRKEIIKTDALLEQGRDYQLVNLDSVLRAKENSNRNLFANFMKDICDRRLRYAKIENHDIREYLEELSDQDEAKRYSKGSDLFRKLITDKFSIHMNSIVIRSLCELYQRNPMSAILGLSWIIQKHLSKNVSLTDKIIQQKPWEKKDIWIKERKEHALLIAASINSQRKLYSGWHDLIRISGYSTMIFLLCLREIWDNWLRSNISGDSNNIAGFRPGVIKANVQSAAIWTVSGIYFDKIQERPNGYAIKAFVERLALAIKSKVHSDHALSYPGHTGFSLSEVDFDNNIIVKKFIVSCVQYGILHEHEHTSKEKKISRKKWYFAPIYAIRFDIPIYTGKEPFYANISQVENWITRDREIILKKDDTDSSNQRTIFDIIEKSS